MRASQVANCTASVLCFLPDLGENIDAFPLYVLPNLHDVGDVFGCLGKMPDKAVGLELLATTGAKASRSNTAQSSCVPSHVNRIDCAVFSSVSVL